MISWQTYEFEKKTRHRDWIWYAGLVFVIAAVLAFFYGDIFFGIFLVIAGLLVVVLAQRDPLLLLITLEEKVFVINDEQIPYERIDRFWIDETQKPDKLLILVRGSIAPLRAFRLEGVSAETVRTELKGHLTEAPLRESFGVKIFERLGF